MTELASSRFIRRASARALACAAVTFAIMATSATSATVASASSANNFYVSTTGTNTGNNCANRDDPCKTISYALQEQASQDVPGTIHVRAGTYVEQVTASALSSNVTIKGAGEGSTIIEPPSSGLSSDSDTDSSLPQYYVVDVQPGTTGFDMQKLTVNGLNASTFLDGDGFGCSQDFVGIYYHASSGLLDDVGVTGADMPPDLFGCQGGLGIYVNSTSTDPADVAMQKVSLTAPTSTSKTKADLPANTYAADILPVKSVPASFTGGDVIVNGYNLQATRDGRKDLLISGTTGTNSPPGSVVNYDADTPSYDKNGVTCDDNWTTCSITDSTIQGDGPTNAVAQNGIQAFGAASVTIGGTGADQGNFVSLDSYAGGGAGNSASGILLLNNGPTSVEDNAMSDSDVNVYAGEVQAFGLVYPTPGTWTIAGNFVTAALCSGDAVTETNAGVGCENGYGVGIQLDSTTNDVVVQQNTVTGNIQSGILLTGVTGSTIGGSAPALGNNEYQSYSGLVVGGPGSECEYAYGSSCTADAGNTEQFSSTGNTIANNSFNDNSAGTIVEGVYEPSIIGASVPDASYGNTFFSNSWESNELVNVADFSGFSTAPVSNSYGSPTPDSCEPSAGGSSTLNDYTMTSGDYWAC